MTLINGYKHTFGIMENRDIYAWGGNEHGQLGLGHTLDVSSPVEWTVLKILPSIEFQWTPSRLRVFGPKMKERILVVMMLSQVDRKRNEPFHPSTFFYLLPKDILYLICQN